MAMLFSVMSFAQVTFLPANETAVESQTFTLTSGDVSLVCSSGTITADQFRFFKSQTVTISSTGGNIVSIEFTCTANNTTKYGPGCFTTTSGDYTYSGKVGTWTGEANEVTFTASSNQVRATQVVVTVLAAGGVPQPSIQGATDFIESTEVSIVAGEGLTVYYTLDGTDPTTESNKYSAPFVVESTTTVKAIAHNGEKASDVTETTFTKATKVTCAEAAEIASQLSANNVLSDLYYLVVGYVTELDGAISNGQQKFWVSDTKDGANTLYSYWCNVPQELVVGDYVQMFGRLTKYYEKNQMKNGDVTILAAPAVTKYTVTVSANNAEWGTVEGAGEYEENEQVTVTALANDGYEFVNWTVAGEEVSTDAEYTFSVTADLALVANFKEVVAEPEYDMEIVCSNLKTMSEGNMTYFMGSSSDGMSIDLVVFGFEGKGTYEVEGSIDAGGEYFTLAGEAEYLYSEELEADALVAVVTANGAMSLKITMYKKTLVPTETIVVENMTKTIQSYGWVKQLTLDGEHETYGQVTLIASGCDGTYGTYAVTAWLGEDIELEGEGEWKNEGELDVLEVIAETADGKVLKIVGQTEYVAPVEPVSMYADVEFTVDEEGILRVTGTTNDEVAVQLYVYGWNEVGYGTYGEGEVVGLIGDTEVANQQYTATIEQEGNVAYLYVILNDAEGNLYDLTAGGMALENPAAGAGSRTTVIVEEAEITTSAMFPTDLEIYGWSNDDREVVIALWDGTTKQYGEYTTDFVVEVDGEQYDLLENTVATYSLEDGLAVLRAAVAAGKDTLDLIVSGAPWVDPATAEPTDTVTLAFTKGTINVSFDGTATIKGGNSDLGVQIFTMGGDIYEGITSEQFNSYSSYLMIDWMQVKIYRGELKVVDLTNDVKVAYIGVLGADYKWYNITLTTADEIPTTLDNINATVAPAKRINNGQLIIINNGVEYNAQGAIVK